MTERVFTFTPVQMQRAAQLESVARRIHDIRTTGGDIGAKPYHTHYENADGKIEFYKVTPQVMWGMLRVRKALYEGLGAPDTAHAIVEKYLGLNDPI